MSVFSTYYCIKIMSLSDIWNLFYSLQLPKLREFLFLFWNKAVFLLPWNTTPSSPLQWQQMPLPNSPEGLSWVDISSAEINSVSLPHSAQLMIFMKRARNSCIWTLTSVSILVGIGRPAPEAIADAVTGNQCVSASPVSLGNHTKIRTPPSSYLSRIGRRAVKYEVAMGLHTREQI